MTTSESKGRFFLQKESIRIANSNALVDRYLVTNYVSDGDKRNKQETLLPQTDRATRHVSHNRVNCKNKCTTNPQQIAVMELRLTDL